MPGKNDAKPLDYADRINRAINFVLRNLNQPINLDSVARAACFSPFHFHRIFRLLVGESLNDFVKRLRLERALALMSRRGWKAQSSQTLTDVAFAVGFSSSSDFARCFKQAYGIAPSRFSVDSFRSARREEWQAAISSPKQRNHFSRLKPGENPDGFRVRLRQLFPRIVAYIRVINSFRPGAVAKAAERLVEWAERRGVADGQWLGYMWDDPEITPYERCRYDVGLELTGTMSDEEVSYLQLPFMEVAELKICGPIALELRALDWLYRTWLPASGYLPSDQPCFEAWNGRPFAHGGEHFELALQLPVIPLARRREARTPAR